MSNLSVFYSPKFQWCPFTQHKVRVFCESFLWCCQPCLTSANGKLVLCSFEQCQFKASHTCFHMALYVSSLLRQWQTHFVPTHPPPPHCVLLLPLQIVKSSVSDTGEEILSSLCSKNAVVVSQWLLALTVFFVTFDNSFSCSYMEQMTIQDERQRLFKALLDCTHLKTFLQQ